MKKYLVIIAYFSSEKNHWYQRAALSYTAKHHFKTKMVSILDLPVQVYSNNYSSYECDLNLTILWNYL